MSFIGPATLLPVSPSKFISTQSPRLVACAPQHRPQSVLWLAGYQLMLHWPKSVGLELLAVDIVPLYAQPIQLAKSWPSLEPPYVRRPRWSAQGSVLHVVLYQLLLQQRLKPAPVDAGPLRVSKAVMSCCSTRCVPVRLAQKLIWS